MAKTTFDPAVIELAIRKAVAGSETPDVQKISEAFIAEVQKQQKVAKLHAKLEKLRGEMATGNTFTTSVQSDLVAAKASFADWVKQRNDALAKDVAIWEGVITLFVGAAGAALAASSGGLSVAAVAPLVTTLITAVSGAVGE